MYVPRDKKMTGIGLAPTDSSKLQQLLSKLEIVFPPETN